MEHFNAEGDEIGDTLSFRVGRRPQLQILDAVVASVPVAVVNHLARQERASEMHGHDQAVLAYVGATPNELPKLARYGDLSIAVADAPVAIAFSNRLVRQWIAVHEETLVVGGAIILGLVRAMTFINRAESPRQPQRRLISDTAALEPQVVAMAKAPGLRFSITLRSLAAGNERREWQWRSRVTSSEDPSVMHLAHVRGVPTTIASLDLALPCHVRDAIGAL